MLKIGHKAPDFNCDAIIDGKISTLSLDKLKDTYTVLFFYPLNFTFVCPTELHAFQNKLEAFKSRNCQVIGVSIDSVHSHLAWLNTPKNVGGITGITYPLISDIHKKMALDFGVLHEDAGIALRGLFLLDKDNIVQHATINNLGLGRNVDETIRMIDALIHHENHGEVCPANWSVGEQAMKPDNNGLRKYFG